MAQSRKKIKPFFGIAVCIFLIFFIYLARWFYYRTMTIHHLLSENKQLKQAITNLTAEEQIGYAKVVTQEKREGKVFTTIRFVETSRDDKLKKILEKEHTIEGDIVHFDALVVKFGDKMVMNGREKALYIWRRVYGEKTAPEEGLPIERPGAEPRRYNDLLKILPSKHRELFWSSIWDLANDPDKLRQHDMRAVYGNVVYSRLKPGLVYIFKISPAGQLYPEVVPDI